MSRSSCVTCKDRDQERYLVERERDRGQRVRLQSWKLCVREPVVGFVHPLVRVYWFGSPEKIWAVKKRKLLPES